MGNYEIKDVLKEENTRCEILTFYKNENCDTPTRVLLYIALAGFLSVGFFIICFLIASCLRFKHNREKRQLELVTPVSSETRLRECVTNYNKYHRRPKQNNDGQNHRSLRNHNNNNNNNNGNSGIMEKNYENYQQRSPSPMENDREINGKEFPVPSYMIREKYKEKPTNRHYANNLNASYQSSNYKKLYPSLSYEKEIDQYNENPYSYPLNTQINNNMNNYYNNDINNGNNYYNANNGNNYYNANKNNYYNVNNIQNNINDEELNQMNKIKNVAYPLNNNKNYYRENYEKYNNINKMRMNTTDNIDSNNDNSNNYNRKIAIQMDEQKNQTYYNKKSEKNNNSNDNIYNNYSNSDENITDKKLKNSMKHKKKGDDSNDTLNKNNVKEILTDGNDFSKLNINTKKHHKIHPQNETTSVKEEMEKKVEVTKKVNVSSRNDNDITYFENKNYINQSNQEEFIHNNCNHNRNKKVQKEMKMVCAVNHIDIDDNNVPKNSINNDENHNNEKINNYNNDTITLDQVKNMTRPVLQLQPQSSPPQPPIPLETEKLKKTKTVNFAPVDYKSHLIRNLKSISPIPEGNRRKISEKKVRKYRSPPPPNQENNNMSDNQIDNDKSEVIMNNQPSSPQNNAIEFEVIDKFDEVQRPINSCGNEQIRNQQYLTYMNNINANLNLPSIPTSTSFDINENIIELEKDMKKEEEEEHREEKDEIKEKDNSVTISSKDHHRKTSKSSLSSSKKVKSTMDNNNGNENQLKRTIMNNPIVQNSNNRTNYINSDLNSNPTQNQPSTNQTNHNYSPKQIPTSSVQENYLPIPNQYYPNLPMDDPDNIYYIPNCYISGTPSPDRNPSQTPMGDNYDFQPQPLSYTNNYIPQPPINSPPMMVSDVEDTNDYCGFVPPRRILSSAENNIPGPPPTASSSYNNNRNNSRPISRRSNASNPYYFNGDIPNHEENNDPDYPMYSSYQSPSYYDSSQNQLYMNNMVIPFQKPKVLVREAPILKKSNNNK